jgi:hypothetical protein
MPANTDVAGLTQTAQSIKLQPLLFLAQVILPTAGPAAEAWHSQNDTSSERAYGAERFDSARPVAAPLWRESANQARSPVSDSLPSRATMELFSPRND